MPEKIAFEWEASSQFRRDSKAGEIVFLSFAICDGDVTAVVHRIEDDSEWHYLSKKKVLATGEVAHTVGCCREDKIVRYGDPSDWRDSEDLLKG